MLLQPVEVKYRCKKCGYSEKFTRGEHIVRNIVVSVLMLLVLLGLFFLLVLLIFGLDPFFTNVVDSNYAAVNAAEDSQLRAIAVSWTRMCDGDDADCYAKAVYQHMSGIRYIPDSLNGNHTYTPLEVLREGSDCKGLSNAYRALLNSVGIRASIEANFDMRHAVAVVPRYRFGERRPGYFVIDLTVPSATLMLDNESVWSYREKQPEDW